MDSRITRFNYLGHAPDRSWTRALTRVTVATRLRAPIAALAATVALTAALDVIAQIRLHAAEQTYARAAERLLALDAAAAGVKQVRARVAAQERLTARVAEIRRLGVARTNEFAWIGNRLPNDTWLSTVRYENGTYSLDGDSDRIAAIGAAMLALRDDSRAMSPSLVSITSEPAAHGERIRYTLRLESH